MLSRHVEALLQSFSISDMQLPDGSSWNIPNPPMGFAAKTRKEQTVLTVVQVAFLEVCYKLVDPDAGGDKSMKLGPRTAKEHMKMLGTRDGEKLYSAFRFDEKVREFWKSNPTGRPTFRVHLLLDHWYIKS